MVRTTAKYLHLGLTWILFSLLIAKLNGSQPLENFIPFGVPNGDVNLRPTNLDDGSSERLPIYITFPFFGQTYNALWVNINGLISLRNAISSWTPTCTAVDLSLSMISPYWSDIDLTYGGNIFYRQTVVQSVLRKVSDEVSTAFPEFSDIDLNWAFVTTWYNVPFNGAPNCNALQNTNTFQTILTSDGTHSFAIFYYNNITFTSGSSGSNCSGIGGNSARAGFDAGNDKSFYIIDGSCTDDIITINERSNVGKPGVWVFRVDNNADNNTGIPLENFMPFGVENGDIDLRPSDILDGSSEQLNLSISFPFFNYTHDSLWVNINGMISLLNPISHYRPICEALAQEYRMIAPFWSDNNMRIGGNVFYRETFNTSVLQKANEEITSAFPEFSGIYLSWAFVVTWYRMPFYGSNSDGCNSIQSRNTYQSVLVSDGIHSFVIFYYNNIMWTTATSSGGNCSGLGGNPAKATIDAADGKSFYTIYGSCTDDVITINKRSNVGTPGMWAFRVDNTDTVNATQSPPIASPSTTTTTTTTTTTQTPITTIQPHPCVPFTYTFRAVINSIQYDKSHPELVNEPTDTLIIIPRTVINNTSPGSVTEKIVYNENIEEIYRWFIEEIYTNLKRFNIKFEQNRVKLPPIVRRNIAFNNRKENIISSQTSNNKIEIVYNREINIDRTIEIKPQTSIDYIVYANYITSLKFNFVALAKISGNDTYGNELTGNALNDIFESCANVNVVEINDFTIVIKVNGLFVADLIDGFFFEVNSESNDDFCEPDRHEIPSDHIKS